MVTFIFSINLRNPIQSPLDPPRLENFIGVLFLFTYTVAFSVLRATGKRCISIIVRSDTWLMANE